MGKKTHEKKEGIKSEIDELFAKKKKVIAKPKETDTKAPEKKTGKNSEKKSVKQDKAKDKVFEAKPSKPKQTKFTEEGFKIYSTDDLEIGKGGETEDCPFDCKCCF